MGATLKQDPDTCHHRNVSTAFSHAKMAPCLARGVSMEELAVPEWGWGGVGVSKLKICFVFHTPVPGSFTAFTVKSQH